MDDTTIVFAGNSRPENQMKIEMCLNRVKNFLNTNHLSMNEAKTTVTEVMVPQKRARLRGHSPSIEITNKKGELETIAAGRYTRILGFNIQDNLSLQAHMETGEKNLLGDLRKKLGALKHLGKQLPKSCRKTLAQGLVISRVTYVSQIWGATTQNYLTKLQSIVNKRARYVTQAGRRTSMNKLMLETGWWTVREMVTFQSLVIMWTIMRKDIPLQIRSEINST